MRLASKIAALASLAMLASCEPDRGTIPASTGGQTVYINYEQEFDANEGRLSVTMPDGEVFTGKFVQQVTESSGDEWEFGDDGDDDFVSTSSTTVSGKTEAILIGNRGNSMECKLQFSRPNCGIDCGGIGKCKRTNGEPLSISF